MLRLAAETRPNVHMLDNPHAQTTSELLSTT